MVCPTVTGSYPVCGEKEVIKSIEEEVKKYRKQIADEKIISLFEMGIEDAKFMNYNDVFLICEAGR